MKIRKRKTAKILLLPFAFFIVSLVAFTFTSIFLKQYNNDLAVNIQVTEIQINSLASENEALQVEIDKLATKSKVVDSIDSDEMQHNKDNIVYIKGNEE